MACVFTMHVFFVDWARPRQASLSQKKVPEETAERVEAEAGEHGTEEKNRELPRVHETSGDELELTVAGRVDL